MIVFLLLSLLCLVVVYKYRDQTRRWQTFQQRGIPYAKPTWPLGSQHMWDLFLSDVPNTEIFKTYLGTELEKGSNFRCGDISISCLLVSPRNVLSLH